MLRFPIRGAFLAALMLFLAGLACSADDVIGQRPALPTPTILAFSTATPGGRTSVFLGTPNAQTVSNNGANLIVQPGQVVGVAATATAGYATRIAATGTAGAQVAVPLFQSNQCPTAGTPPTPKRPTAFALYPQAIALYLSAGGATTTLEATLRGWGAINDGRGVVQSDTDLTGDGIREIIVTIFDPALYKPTVASPGQLLIFGCDQQAYKLLYSTPYSANTVLPELRRVGNMNGDGRAQVAFTQQICMPNGAAATCTQAMQILNWNSVIGTFIMLNDALIDATNARVQIGDVDGDGLLEVTITFNPPLDVSVGPWRRTVHLWDWNGANYTLAAIQTEAATYRIHAMYDADAIFQVGDFRGAVRAWDKLKDDPTLAAWAPNDALTIRALANFRKLTAFAALRQTKAIEDLTAAMQGENPPGSITEGWAQLATAFNEAYKANRQLKKLCSAMQGAFSLRSDMIAQINIYGEINHEYTIAELCPF